MRKRHNANYHNRTCAGPGSSRMPVESSIAHEDVNDVTIKETPNTILSTSPSTSEVPNDATSTSSSDDVVSIVAQPPKRPRWAESQKETMAEVLSTMVENNLQNIAWAKKKEKKRIALKKAHHEVPIAVLSRAPLTLTTNL